MKKVFTLLLLLLTFSSYAQKAKLELKLQKDSTYYTTLDVKLSIDQFMQNTHQIANTTLTGKMAHKVVSVQDTSYTMDVSYKNITMFMELGSQKISFSSDGDTSNIASKATANMIDRPFTIILSKRGLVIAVKNTENLFENIFNGFPPIDAQKKAQLLAQLRQSFGENAIKGNLQEAFIIFPKEPVTIKSTWTNQTSLGIAISAKINSTYTLNNITDKNYEISGAAVVTPNKAAEFRTFSSCFMRFTNADGTYVSKINIDKVTGWVTSSRVVKHIKAIAEIKQSSTGPVIMTYPVTMDGVLTAKNQE